MLLDKVKAYLSLARISNSPTIISNVCAGAAIAGGFNESSKLILLSLSLLLFYTAGMFMNDLCDYNIDLEQRPFRPIVSGQVSNLEALIWIISLLIIGSLLLLIIKWQSFLAGIVLIGLVIYYNLKHKSNPLSPLVMALCRVMIYVVVFLSFSMNISQDFLILCGLLFLYVTGLSFIARSEVGNQRLKGHWPLIILILPAFYFILQSRSALTLIWGGLFLIWITYSASFVYMTKRRNMGSAVTKLIAGISLFDSLVLYSFNQTVGTFIAVICFGLTLLLQRTIRGT